MKRQRCLTRTAHHAPIGRLARLEHFAHCSELGLEVWMGQDLVVGDDV